MDTTNESRKAISKSFPFIREECKAVFGSELHYQAMVYHLLRYKGQVALEQLGMNVKTNIENCQTDLFKDKIDKKNINYRSAGLEIIPDISFYAKSINCDWRRRNYHNTLEQTLYSLEIKASERHKSRLGFGEIKTDILKLKAQLEETDIKFNKKIGIGMMIVDVAPLENERMTSHSLDKIVQICKLERVDLWYFNQSIQIEMLIE